MISVENLCKSFGDLEILKGITENIEKGEKVVIIGPSGSGKSTFLRCLNLLEKPTSAFIICFEMFRATRPVFPAMPVTTADCASALSSGTIIVPGESGLKVFLMLMGMPAVRTGNTDSGCSTSAPI